MIIIYVLFLLIISVFLISKGSDWVTDSMIPVAKKLGTSYIAVSTLLVSALISMPEVITTLYSYFLGHNEIGIGVIIGSVMVNIGITVGLSAAIKPLNIDKHVVLRDGIYLITIAVIVMVFGTNLSFERSEGIILMLLFIPYMLNVWIFEKDQSLDSKKRKIIKIENDLDMLGDQFKFFDLKPSVFTFLFGSFVLLAGSYFFAFSLVKLGNILSLPGLIVGMVFGAIGTNVPNIAAALAGTVKGYEDVAISETFGANIFTLLITLGLFIIVSPFKIAANVLYYDLTWMIFIHLLMILFIFKGYKFKEKSLTRYEGIILILFYLGIIGINITFFS